MALEAKICGLNSLAAVEAAAKGGAGLIGLNFYPPSPRAVTPEEAAQLAGQAPPGITRVGLFVDPDDDQLAATLAKVPLDLLQLHGGESPRRVAEIRARFARPVMKVIKLAKEEDLAAVPAYATLVDRLKQADVADCELGCMHTNGQASGARVEVVARESPLPYGV